MSARSVEHFGEIGAQSRFDIGIDDIPLVGGKNASLGEMYCELTPRGVKVPNGFAITTEPYCDFLESAGIRESWEGLDMRDVEQLRNCGRKIRSAILGSTLPQDLEYELLRLTTNWPRGRWSLGCTKCR
jgi:pyruvate, water dikinase